MWDTIKKIITPAAPLLGGMISGPAGPVVSAMIASALGVEDKPEAIEKALCDDPQALIRIKEIESNERIALQRLAVESESNRLAADTSRIDSINQTMRVEAKSEDWWQSGWRPFWGFITGGAFLVVCILICILAFVAVTDKSAEAMTMIPQLITSFTTLFGIPGAILGVASWHRGKKQRLQAGEQK